MHQIHPANEGPQPQATAPRKDLTRKLSGLMLRTVVEHGLIEEGDRILVALSGGKDSYTLLDLLMRAQRKSPVKYHLVAFHLDQAQPGYDGRSLKEWLEATGCEFEVAREDTYSAVMEDAEGKEQPTYCRLCSRLRRGILYTAAERHGCNKLALGHHLDDSLQTLMLNLFYSGKLQAMPASYETNDGRFQVIRPLIECTEADIEARAEQVGYPILPCNLCGSQSEMKRVAMAEMLKTLEQSIPDVKQVMLAALKNVRPTHLLDREVQQAWVAQADQFEPRR